MGNPPAKRGSTTFSAPRSLLVMPAVVLFLIVALSYLATVIVGHIKTLIEDEQVFITVSNEVYGLATVTVVILFMLVGLFGISSRRQLEASRRSTAILEATLDGVVTWDETGRIESCNPAAREMFGAAGNVITGRLLSDLLPEFDVECHSALSIETEGCRLSGERFPVEVSVSETSLTRGKPLYTLFIRDISERKRVEQELVTAVAERQKLDDELNIARDIQINMLPKNFPPFPDRDDVDIFAFLRPAREVGGDFYDFFELPNGHLCFTVGDVSGKGIPSALFMTLAKAMVESRAFDDEDPGRVMTAVNEALCKGNDANMFVTLFLAVLDTEHRIMHYCNAGHNPPYVLKDSGELVRLDARHGPIVGAMEGIPYGTGELTIDRGDTLFIYTDGVTDATDEDRQLYGEERLKSTLGSLRFESATQIVSTIADDVDIFEGNSHEQADDITILTVRFAHEYEDSRVVVLELTLDNRVEEIARVNKSFNEMASLHHLSEEDARKFNIVFDELLSNIIYYSAVEDQPAHIRIRIEFVADAVNVAITSFGVEFDPLTYQPPDTTLSLEDRNPGGLGIHIVKSLMDEMTYYRRTNQNVINLVKRVECDAVLAQANSGVTY